MILNKYNEIMSNVTVDPEMKVRIMAAVSAAIREHPEQTVVTDIFDEEDEPPVRRKARKTPIIVISSIAAGILVLAGVFFVMRGLGSEKMASTEGFRDDPASKNVNYEATEAAADTIGYEINAYVDERSNDIAENTTGNADSNTAGNNQSGSQNYAASTTRDNGQITVETADDSKFFYKNPDASEGMGDARLDNISRELPFDMKGSGTGTFSDTVTQEVFIGVDGQKMLLLKASEGTDIIKAFDPSCNGIYTDSSTPEGTAVKLYRIAFGNVKPLGKGETSTDINAALFMRDGNVYLLVFSEPQPSDVILRVADVV